MTTTRTEDSQHADNPNRPSNESGTYSGTTTRTRHKGLSRLAYVSNSTRSLTVVTSVVLYIVAIGACIVAWRAMDMNNPNLPTTELDVAVLILVFLFSILLSLIATKLLLSVLPARTISVSPEDRRLLETIIKDNNERAMDLYIRLSSLHGATGTVTKLGMTGLPLITVLLTIFFSLLALKGGQTGYMDLAKLALGAFIGSFVQRAATGRRTTDR